MNMNYTGAYNILDNLQWSKVRVSINGWNCEPFYQIEYTHVVFLVTLGFTTMKDWYFFKLQKKKKDITQINNKTIKSTVRLFLGHNQ